MKKMLYLCFILCMTILILSCNSISTRTAFANLEGPTVPDLDLPEAVLQLDSLLEVSAEAIRADHVLEGSGSPEFFIPTILQNFSDAKFSPGGKFIRTPTSLFSTADGIEIRPHSKMLQIAPTAVYPSEGRVFYVAGKNGIFGIDAVNGEVVKKLNVPIDFTATIPIGAMFLSDDNKYLIIDPLTNYEVDLYIYNLETDVIITKSDYFGPLLDLVPDSTIAVYSFMDELRGIDWKTEKLLWSAKISNKTSIIHSVAHGPGDSTLYAVVKDNKQKSNVYKVDGLTGSSSKIISDIEGLVSVFPHPDGRHLFAGFNSYEIGLIDLESKKVISTYNTYDAMVPLTRQLIQKMAWSLDKIDFELSANGRYLLFHDMNRYGTFFSGLYDLEEGRLIAPIYPEEFIIEAFPTTITKPVLLDEDKIIAVKNESEIIMWNTETGLPIKDQQRAERIIFPVIDQKDPFKENDKIAADETDTFKILVAGNDSVEIYSDFQSSEIILQDTKTGAKLKTLKGHDTISLYCGNFSQDGVVAATAGTDGTIQIWDLKTGKRLKELVIGTEVGWANLHLMISNDIKRIYLATYNGFDVYSIESGEMTGSLRFYEDGGWLTTTESGYFTGNEAGIEKVKVRMGNRVLPLDSFYDQFYNPMEVAAAFSSEPHIAQSAQPKLAMSEITIAPPKVNLFIETAEGSFINTNLPAAAGIIHEEDTIKIRVEAVSSQGKIGEIKVRNNGKLLDQNIRGLAIVEELNRVVQEFNIPIIEGSNIITAVALSEQFIESAPVQITVKYNPVEQSAPDMYVIAVGIDQYKNKRYSLDYAVGDVKGFIKSLLPIAEPLYDEVFQTVIINDNAVKENILSQLESVAAKAQPEDVFVFYYAGHGIALTENQTGMKNEFYYVLHDVTQMTSVDGVRKSGISGSEIREIFSRIPAQKQIAMIDACNSGAMAETFAYRGAAEEQALAKLSRATGSVIIAATRDDQFAAELASLGHGAFTMAVIEALDGEAVTSNQQITASSIRLYLDDRLPEITAEHSGSEQYPISFIFGQDFPIGISP